MADHAPSYRVEPDRVLHDRPAEQDDQQPDPDHFRVSGPLQSFDHHQVEQAEHRGDSQADDHRTALRMALAAMSAC